MNEKNYSFYTKNTGPHQITMSNGIAYPPIQKLLHINIEEAAEGKAILTMPFLYEFAQSKGLMNGGVLFTLADGAVATAIKSLIPQGTFFASISAECKFLYPVKQGIVTAKAEITRQEERFLYGKATVYNEENKPVFEFSSVFKIARDQNKNPTPKS